jgi:predicted Zn finger-like uncharacterized protein
MKYITSCPKCDTHFLINDELIKAHRGKVQCGSCEHVFNAKTRLTEVADEITSADEYHAIVEESERESETEEIIITASNAEDAEFINTADTFLGELSPSASKSNQRKLELDNDTTPIVDDFINKSRSRKKISRPITKVLAGIFSVLLICSALLQVIYYSRIKIAAEYPQFKPLLVQACAHINCSIDLPKNLDLIAIGDSDMQEDDNYESVINFTSSLKNSANYAQVYPNIELTLTDFNDQVAIKKLLLPKDYVGTDKKIEDGVPANETVMIHLALHVHDAEVAGYRMLLHY